MALNCQPCLLDLQAVSPRDVSRHVLSSYGALCPARCLRVSMSSLQQVGSLLHGRSLQAAHAQATQRECCLLLV